MSGEGSSRGVSRNFEIIKNQRGLSLLHAGHTYYKRRVNNSSTVWVCVNRQKNIFKCNGSVTLHNENNALYNEIKHVQNCVPNFENNAETNFLLKCKDDVCQNYIPVQKIYEKNVDEFKKKAVAASAMPEYNKVKSTLYKHRNKHLKVHKTRFLNAVDVTIPEEFQHFVLVDYCERENRIIVFASTYIKEQIKNIKHCFADGTFKCCARPFIQLYSIQGDIGSCEDSTNIVPLFYVLLMNKEARTYEIMFKKIKETLPEWNPVKFSFDFEIAAMNAAEIVFSNVEIRGCYVHFQRCVFKKAKSLNLLEHGETKDHVKMCMCLVYLPKEDIEDGWLTIMESSFEEEQVVKFNDYFVSQWLEPPDMIAKWSCYKERHRTTNLVEAWNSRFNRNIGRNASFLLMLQTISNDISKYETAQERFSNGVSINKRRKTSISNDVRISELTRAYDEGKFSIYEFLKELSKSVPNYCLK